MAGLRSLITVNLGSKGICGLITLKRTLVLVAPMFGELPGAFSPKENQGHEWDTYVGLNVHHVRNTGWPTGRESYGHGASTVVVGVTPHQGDGNADYMAK